MRRIFVTMFLPGALFVLGCNSTHETQTANGEPVAQSPRGSAVDLHNTVCPVSGDKVEGSKLVETYDGKIYHLCCADCPKDFRKNPKKYADEVAADPAKYGVK